MDDLISRQAVLDDLDQLWDMDTVDGIKASTVLKQVKTDIKNLPSAQPEWKKGKWVDAIALEWMEPGIGTENVLNVGMSVMMITLTRIQTSAPTADARWRGEKE